MKLSFRDLKQQKFTIDAEPSDLISSVKEKIAEEKGWETSQQKLIYSGKILQDANTVESYKIEERGFIVCMISKPKPAASAATASISQAPSTAAPATTSATPAPPLALAQSATSATIAVPMTPTPAGASATPDVIPATSSESATTGLAMGAERAAQIAELESMGFERSQIDAAMRAAFYNSERAVEYLLNGIPDSIQQGVVPAAATPASVPDPMPAPATEAREPGPDLPTNLFDDAAALGTAGRGATGGGGAAPTARGILPSTVGAPGGLGNLDFLRNNPQFQQLRQVIQQQPQMLEPILQQVGAGNPQLAALIGQHPDQFLQLLSEEVDGDAPLPPGAQSISVTEDERAAIERLCLLGFERDLAIQAYFACDKNEELAANFLFDQPDDEEQ